MLAGATFAFVLSLGDFLAPLLLGGPSGIMISNIVVSLFGAAYNWPLGAAICFRMLVLVIGLRLLSERLEKKWSFRWAPRTVRTGFRGMQRWCSVFFISQSSLVLLIHS